MFFWDDNSSKLHSRLRSGISWCQVPQRVAQPSPQADLLALGLQYLAPLEIPRGIPNGCHIDAAWDMVPGIADLCRFYMIDFMRSNQTMGSMRRMPP